MPPTPDSATSNRRSRYKDDNYIASTVANLKVIRPRLLAVLKDDGLELQPQKCRLWFPRLDHQSDEEVAPQIAELFETFPRARGGLFACGNAA